MGTDYYRTMEQGGKKAAAATRETQRSLADLNSQLATVRSSAAGLAGAWAGAFATHQLVAFADTWNQLNGRLRLASSSSEDYVESQRVLMEISQRTGTSLEANSNLYSRIAQSLRDAGYASADVAKVTETVATSLKLSGASTEEASSVITQLSHRLILNLPSGASQARTIQAVNGKAVTVSTAYSETPQAESVWVAESDELYAQQYRVISISDNNDGTFTVTGAAHDPDKYARIDTGAIIDQRPVSVIPPGNQSPPANIVISSFSVVQQNISVETMRVSWDQAQNAIAYEAQWRRNDGTWVNVPRSSTTSFDVPGIYAGLYLVRVRAINAAEISSGWGYSEEKMLTGKVGNPPKPVGFAASDNVLFGIELTWGFPANTDDTLKTEIQYSPTGSADNALLLADVPYPQQRYQQMGLRAGQIFWYRAQLVDRTGNESGYTDWVRGMSSDQASDYLEAIKNEVLSAEDGKALTEQIDFNIAGVLQNTLAGIQGAKITFQQFGAAYAEISNAQILIADANQAFAQFQELVAVQFAGNAAEINEVKTAQATADQAFAEYKLVVSASFNGVNTSIDGINKSVVKVQADVVTLQTAQADASRAFAEYQQQVTATFGQQQAAINQKMTSVVDATSASAIYTLRAGVNYNGQYYDAGLSIATIASGSGIVSRVAINADQFVMLSGQAGTQFSPFAVVGGQVFLNSAFIQEGTITSAMIAGYIQSTNYVAGSAGWRLNKAGTLEINGSTGGGQLKITPDRIVFYDASNRPLVVMGKPL